MLPDDQLAMLARESRRQHEDADGGMLDFALLTDGLDAEREQGITIDVAYRYFHTARAQLHRRRLPRARAVHPQHGDRRLECRSRRGAGGCEKGPAAADAPAYATYAGCWVSATWCWRSTRWIWSTIDRPPTTPSPGTIGELAQSLGITEVHCLPVSALTGENVGRRSQNMPWYDGGSLLEVLETIDVSRFRAEEFRMPVQWVNRPDQSFRGYAGTISGGTRGPRRRDRRAAGRSAGARRAHRDLDGDLLKPPRGRR